ncbi:hypothetical protein [Streptomyces sp. MMBL 11-1]|uniref:hypothetical protein n=1 Tax=Streptomyces sp. MMBL 11-1 TaxID=3026420 RepID=UPI00235DEB26|nr:hypothetical protein [Streptomyces sp. MMBL 11-1]
MAEPGFVLLGKNWTFDTVAEKGCRVVTEPDHQGCFLAVDSSGVQCEFTTNMVQNARRPEYLVAARLVIDGAELGVTHEAAVAFSSAADAVNKLDPKSSEMFAVWAAGDVEPSKESVEVLTQGTLPQQVHVYAGGRLWLLDDMHVGDTRGDCRG